MSLTETTRDNHVSDSGRSIHPVLIVNEAVLQQYSRMLRQMMVGIMGAGQRSVLVCPDVAEAEKMLCQAADFVEYPRFRLPFLGWQNRKILLDDLFSLQPSILHGFQTEDAVLLQYLSEVLEVPYVLTFFKPVNRTQPRQWNPDTASALIAVSEPIADNLRITFPQCRDQIIQIPVGAYVEENSACFQDPIRQPSIVIAQDLDDLETFEPLLQAARHLVLDGYDFSIGIIGSGIAEDHIRKRIRMLGLTPMITIVPKMNPLRSILQEMDIFLHLKDWRLWNPMLQEAMSVGLAVAGCADRYSGLLKDQQNAAIMDPEDELSIYSTLKKVLNQRAWARQLGLNAQEKIRQGYKVSAMLDQTIDVYKGVRKKFSEQRAKKKAE